MTGTIEVGEFVKVVDQGGCGCPYLKDNLRCGVLGGPAVQVGDVVDETTYWEGLEQIPIQGVPQDDRTATLVRTGRRMGVSPYGKIDDGGGITGGGDIHFLPLEHSHTVHCEQAHYGPVSGGGAVYGVNSGQVVVVTGQIGLGQDVDGGLGGITDRGRGRDIYDGDKYGINRWEDNVANVILVTEHNAPLAYAPGLELHHLIMSNLGRHGGRIYI